MTDLTSLFLQPAATVREAIRVIDQGSVQIALVVDAEQYLLGTVTDGDIRRGLLGEETLESPVEKIMNRKFNTLPADSSEQKVEMMMRDQLLHQIPGLDSKGRIVRLFIQRELLPGKMLSNWVVLMAGGQGKRLRPDTENCPKPMLPVGGKPILEIILKQCINAGFRKFFISVNYLKEQITGHFGNGDRWGVKIHYLVEDQPLGTAGALTLLPKPPSHPILVINGDVLTRVDFANLLFFHQEHKASATLCVREEETQIPYGVITSRDYRLLSMREKPVVSHQIIAGVYVLEPHMLELLPPDKCFDMPVLLKNGKAQGKPVFVFPIHEYWLDVGHAAALERVNDEWDG